MSRVISLYDKGCTVLAVTEAETVDAAATGEPLVITRGSVFIRGEGGFGGSRGPAAGREMPTRQADEQVVYHSGPEQHC